MTIRERIRGAEPFFQRTLGTSAAFLNRGSPRGNQIQVEKTVSHSVAKVDFRLTGGHCSWPHPTCRKQCFFVLQEVLRGGGYVTAFFTVTHSGVDRGEKRAKTRRQNSTLSVNSFPAFLWSGTAVATRPSSHVRGGTVFSEEAGITRLKARTDSSYAAHTAGGDTVDRYREISQETNRFSASHQNCHTDSLTSSFTQKICSPV